MHTSFTGSTKKARQVNLQGRANVNPWNQNAGPAAKIAQLQAEREKRALDRARLNAARNIQRVWRGHRSKRRKQAEWRAQWDAFEQQHRRHSAGTVALTEQQPPSYASMGDLVHQLRLLLHFFDIWSSEDHKRLLVMAATLNLMLSQDASVGNELPLHKFGATLAHALSVCDQVAIDQKTQTLRSRRKHGASAEDIMDDSAWKSFCSTVLDSYLTNLHGLTEMMAVLAPEYCSAVFTALSSLRRWASRPVPDRTQILIARNAGSCLDRLADIDTKMMASTPSSNYAVAYPSLVELLTAKELFLLPETLAMLTGLGEVDYLATLIHSQIAAKHASNWLPVEKAWNLLGYFLLCRTAKLESHTSAPVMIVITTLLGLLERMPEEKAESHSQTPRHSDEDIPDTLRATLKSLADTPNIDRFLTDIAALPVEPAESARIMAKYALSLLRAFPDRSYDIRMRIFLNHTATSTSAGPLTSLQSLWQASQRTEIFRIISQSQRNVLSLLKPNINSEVEQIGRPGLAAKRNSQAWKDDWQLILFFLEMYTSALKLMDDEEFFSLNQENGVIMSGTREDAQRNRGSLPLSDVVQMVIFLKNLTYTIYWNPTELSHRFEKTNNELAAQLSPALIASDSRALSGQPDLAGLEGVTQPYLKGLTTGVLRMLHERDSRRKFLPDNGWLMTSQVDMTSFIPEVVHEEEKRLNMGDVEEDDDSEDDLDDSGVNETNNWSPRANFRVSRYGRLGSRQPDIVNRFVRKQEKAQRRNQVAAVAPRLELLRNLPFFIPFETRVNIFRQFVHNDQYRRRNGAVDPHLWRMTVEHMGLDRNAAGGREILSKHTAKIRREHVFQDAFDQFYPLGESLKEPIYIKFFDNQGIEERGIDGGGVTKEFLTSVTSQAFTPLPPGLSWFVENDQHYLHPNSDLYEIVIERNRRMGHLVNSEITREGVRNLRQQYEFLGRIVGKCLYEGILIDVRFAGFFLLKWALTGGTTSATNETAYRPTLNDMRDMDPDIYHHLLALKNWAGNVEEDFGLNFTITDNMALDEEGTSFSKTRELIQNGANTPVTNANRLLYIDRFVRYRLQHHPKIVTDAFLKGLGQMIEPMWLAMFNQKELQWLIGGDDSELDLADLRRNTDLGGIYQRGDDPQDHPTIELFWNVLKEMEDKDRREILRFATSTPRAPLLGFSNLNPKFSIRDSTNDEGRHDLNRLPTSSTCVNQLKLPPYKSKAQMREKLLYAAKSGAGFDLS